LGHAGDLDDLLACSPGRYRPGFDFGKAIGVVAGLSGVKTALDASIKI